MAITSLPTFVLAFAFALALALATAEDLPPVPVLKGSVACLDCPKASHDLSGLQVLVKCDKVKKLAMAYTLEDGSFTADLPSDGGPTSSNCLAKIMGGPHQLYISARNSLVDIKEEAPASSQSQFTTTMPLGFYTSCPPKATCQGKDMGFASSKTVDFPIPREWGLAPSSYYVPFIPIIGIP